MRARVSQGTKPDDRRLAGVIKRAGVLDGQHHGGHSRPLERAFAVRRPDFLHRHPFLGEEAIGRLRLRLSLAGRRKTHRGLCPERGQQARGATVQTLVAEIHTGHLARRPVRLFDVRLPLHCRIVHHAVLLHPFSCWRTSHQSYAALSTPEWRCRAAATRGYSYVYRYALNAAVDTACRIPYVRDSHKH